VCSDGNGSGVFDPASWRILRVDGLTGEWSIGTHIVCVGGCGCVRACVGECVCSCVCGVGWGVLGTRRVCCTMFTCVRSEEAKLVAELTPRPPPPHTHTQMVLCQLQHDLSSSA
jgi:hypothetical protein